MNPSPGKRPDEFPADNEPLGGRRCTPKAIINVSSGFPRLSRNPAPEAVQVQSHNKLGKPARSRMEPWDVTIVGGGVLGTSIAYWLAQQYEGRIAVLEKEVDVAAHTSRRNTGVVHRPFYLDPVGRKVFARCAEVRLAAPEEERVYVDPRRKISVRVGRGQEPHRTRYLINCAGGNSIDIAHRLGVGREYTDLHFRGEYWEIDPAHHYLSSRNIYTVPRHPELPFLDPHWIVRADGRREIGPNAVPVSGPYTYRGFLDGPDEMAKKLRQ